MTAARREHTSSALQAWVRALSMTAPIGTQSDITFPMLLPQLADRQGERPALLSAGLTLSYRQLADSAARYARWARAEGLRPGSVVALLMHNHPQYLALWLGITRVGASVALLNTHLRAAALAHCVRIVSPRALIVGAGLFEALESAAAQLPPTLRCWTHGATYNALPRIDLAASEQPAAPLPEADCPAPRLEDRALYLYTSGTTGLPKAANVSHFRVMQWSHWFAGLLDTQPEDRLYDCLPMYHSIGGVVAPGALLVRGGSVVLRERFSASDFWRDIVEQRCTLFQYIGELCRYLLASPSGPLERAHALRAACGNGLRADIWEAFRERFAIPRILEYYASTEGNFSLYNCEGRVGAIGRIPPFLSHRVRVALVEYDPDSGLPYRDGAGRCRRVSTGAVGEALGALGTEGTARFEGYADAAASEQKILRDVFEPGDAWYRTGDLMRQDAQGFFYFVDRVGDTFRWKGENVAASEVAAVIESQPHVRACAVYGVRVPGHDGRAGMATLVVEAGFELSALQSALEAALPAYARPLFVRIAPALALTGTFKLDKASLAREGYDPAQVRDPLYVFDRTLGAYRALYGQRHGELSSGSWRA